MTKAPINSMKNEMFTILITKIECVVAVSGLLYMGSSRTLFG